ncbi:MAG TPA: hybrid sensor histidine kinase/response regulator [Candidatus Didemnitutus sp.]|nr:hybrid sensor histidine kinase/response regulator [Candidatus Didemnitutus sp.]
MNPPSESSPTDLRGRRLLVVDDDRLNLMLLSRILQPEGYEVIQANSGEAALEKYSASNPDLVLLDVMMPGINGFETCRELKRRCGDNLAPVVFITAKTESEDVVEGLAAGGVDYLPKPFRPRETLARIRTHLQNRLLVAQQRKLVEQLSSANAAKNRLLGMVAHDLRNPLSTMRGLAEFLRDDARDGKLSTDQAEIIESIYGTSQSMLTMVNELLDAAVIESGEIKIHPQPSSLADLLENSVTLNNINAAKKGSKIVLHVKGLPGAVSMDGGKIKQVVDNLISNAIKFSPPSSLVTVEAGARPTDCMVAVIDQGPGIPEGEHDKLFKDFSQTSVKPTAGEKSTGLGLAICRRIIEAHGGSISAHNRREGGCAFMFSLPLSA